jgi:glycerate-2-kinase
VPAAEYKIEKLADDLVQIKRSELWKNFPFAIRDYLAQVQIEQCFFTENQFNQRGIRAHTFVLANIEHGAQAAEKAARKMGLNTLVVTTALEGEARDVGIFWASIAKEVTKNRRPVPPPCVLIFAGEMTVTLDRTSCGTGGRNQEAVLSAACKLDGAEHVVILSVGTDGTDGPNPVPVAGGIVDGNTAGRASAIDIQLSVELRRHNSYYVLNRLDDAVFFDQPGNNVCDLTLVVVI